MISGNKGALAFIEANRRRPFFLYVPYHAIHSPHQAPDATTIRRVGVDARGLKTSGDKRAAVTGMLARMDEGVGQIVQRLRDHEIAEQTLVLFFSDNGGYFSASSNAPCRGQKGDLYEGGHRVPAIAWWPKTIAANQVCDDVVMTMDLFPTILGLAGVAPPAGLRFDGVDIRGALLDGAPLGERTVFWRFLGQKAARRAEWKWLVGSAGNEALYNLREDVQEQHDLSSAHPEIVSELANAFAAWEADVTHGVVWLTKR